MGWIGEAIRWKELYYASMGLFVLIIALAPFRPVAAMVVSFMLLATWSRIPCMVSDWTKDMEFLDFFTVLVAINLGILGGAAFAGATFAFSALFARYEHADYKITEFFCFALCGAVTPLIYWATGQNLLLTMYLFTAVRYGFTVVQYALFLTGQLIYVIQILMVSAIIAYTSNTIMVKVFGDFLMGLFGRGIGLDWNLLGILSIVLIYASLSRIATKPIEMGGGAKEVGR